MELKSSERDLIFRALVRLRWNLNYSLYMKRRRHEPIMDDEVAIIQTDALIDRFVELPG